MKILLLKNNVIDSTTVDNGLIIAKQWLAGILDLDVFEVATNKKFTSSPFSNSPNTEGYASGYQVTPQEVFDEAKTQGYVFDIDSVACLVYDSAKIFPNPTNPIDNGVCIQIPINWYVNFPEVFAEFLLHELCHYYFSATNKTDTTHTYQQGFTTRKDWYIYLLKGLVQPYIPTPTNPTYKYFSQAEVLKWQLTPQLWQMLDKARALSNTSYNITSGRRTVSQNTSVGGVEGSEHIFGTGCDIMADTSEKRIKIVSGALQAGFTRIGIYNNHVHLGIGKLPNFPQNVMWVLNKD